MARRIGASELTDLHNHQHDLFGFTMFQIHGRNGYYGIDEYGPVTRDDKTDVCCLRMIADFKSKTDAYDYVCAILRGVRLGFGLCKTKVGEIKI